VAGSFNAGRDAYTAFSGHGSATVNVGIGIATALPELTKPDAPALPPGYRPREVDVAALKSFLIDGNETIGIVGRPRAAG
jgi:hypothetical protein